jgi:hypothetical protein
MFGSRVTAPSAVVQPKAPGTPEADWQDEPIGPDDLTIRTPDGTVAAPESWLALVYSALREPGGFLNVCSGPPDLYAQAINHEGHVVLEYRDGAPNGISRSGTSPTRSRRPSLAVDERRSTIMKSTSGSRFRFEGSGVASRLSWKPMRSPRRISPVRSTEFLR